VVEALNHLGGSVARAGFLATIRDVGVFDLDGITLSYGPGKNQGTDNVYLTLIQSDGSFKAVDQLNSADTRWQEPGAGAATPKPRHESTK